ncbi:glycosyltransferase family 2 protein [Candidatus Omnitrophota bacterium]
MTKFSISIIIPALNEEENLIDTVDTIVGAVKDRFSGYEIIIFDDCSVDSTGEIADRLAKSNVNIRVVHNSQTMCFGYNFKEGVKLAQYDYLLMIPGDNDVARDTMTYMFGFIGLADCVISHVTNVPCDRPLWRRVISKIFTFIINTAYGLNLRYFNGPTIYKADVVKGVDITTHSFAYQVEILSKMLKKGRSYMEIPITLKGRVRGTTKAFNLKNILNVVKAFLRIFWFLRIKNRKIYNKKGIKIEAKEV